MDVETPLLATVGVDVDSTPRKSDVDSHRLESSLWWGPLDALDNCNCSWAMLGAQRVVVVENLLVVDDVVDGIAPRACSDSVDSAEVLRCTWLELVQVRSVCGGDGKTNIFQQQARQEQLLHRQQYLQWLLLEVLWRSVYS
jgi:hypothetical protein